MSLIKMVVAELRCRILSAALGMAAVAVSAAAFVVGPSLLQAYNARSRREIAQLQKKTQQRLAQLDKQTRRIMRDLGINLRIVHRDTNFGGLYTDFKAVDFPEEYVDRLANAPQIETIVHLVATLQEKIKWNGRTVLLVGMRPVLTQSQKNAEKKHMVQPVAPGTVIVGYELGAGRKAGDSIEILGKTFHIAAVRPQAGTIEDVQLVMDLHEAQTLVHKPGRIHQILALNCKCKGDRISVIRKELEGVLPDTKITEHLSRATAREAQRDAVEKSAREQMEQLEATRRRTERSHARLLSVVLPLLLVFSALLVGLLSWLNVRDRRSETGILRAIGKSSLMIATLFLGRAVLVGLAGGLVGVAAGTALVRFLTTRYAGDLFVAVPIDARLIAGCLVGAPLVAAMAAYLPTLRVVAQDPAAILSDAV